MHSLKRTSIQRELSEFFVGLKNYQAYRISSLSKQLTKQQIGELMNLRERLVRESGKFSPLVRELTGKETIRQRGEGPEYSYDMWQAALAVKFDKSALNALQICIDYTSRTIGKLDDEITKGIRNELGDIIQVTQPVNEGISTTSYTQEESQITERTSSWKEIEKEFGITKRSFGKQINFVSGNLKRTIIFRDIEDAFTLSTSGYSKPAVILAGSVIEELLRLYLKHKNIAPVRDNFEGYIKACNDNGLLKGSVSQLSHAVRQFRNLVHISAEKTKKYSISKPTAIGAVSSIFTIANDF